MLTQSPFGLHWLGFGPVSDDDRTSRSQTCASSPLVSAVAAIVAVAAERAAAEGSLAALREEIARVLDRQPSGLPDLQHAERDGARF